MYLFDGVRGGGGGGKTKWSMTKWILVRPKSGCVRAKIGLTGQLVDKILPLIFEVHCYSQRIIQRSSSALQVIRAMVLLQPCVMVGSRECSSLDLSSSSSSNWTSSWTLGWSSSLTSQSCISSWTSFRVIFSDEDVFLVITPEAIKSPNNWVISFQLR